MASIWTFHALNANGIPISLRTGLGYTRNCVILYDALITLNLTRRIVPYDWYDPHGARAITLRIRLGPLEYILSFEVVDYLPPPIVASLGLLFLRGEHANVCLSRRVITLQDDGEEYELPLVESHQVTHSCTIRCRCAYLHYD